MMQNKTTYLSILILLFFSCKYKQILNPPPDISDYTLTDLCDLPQHKNELIYTRATYSGVEEYWGLSSINCKDINAELEIPDNITIDTRFRKLLEDVHKKYWDRYLVIDIIGKFEQENKTGYGHLGSNNAKFIVKKIINIQLVLKKK